MADPDRARDSPDDPPPSGPPCTGHQRDCDHPGQVLHLVQPTAFNRRGAGAVTRRLGAHHHGGTERAVCTQDDQGRRPAGVPLLRPAAPTRPQGPTSARQPARARPNGGAIRRLRADPDPAHTIAAGSGRPPDDARSSTACHGDRLTRRQVTWRTGRSVRDAGAAMARYYRPRAHGTRTGCRAEPFKCLASRRAAAEVEVAASRRVPLRRATSCTTWVTACRRCRSGDRGGLVQGVGGDLEEWSGRERRPARGRLNTRRPARTTSALPESGGVLRPPVRARHRVRRGVRVQGGRRAAPDGGLQRSRGTAAGRGGVRTGRAQRRAGQSGDPGGGVLGGRGGPR